jgi:formylglycine-generating enzyme required for sulfatase activity
MGGLGTNCQAFSGAQDMTGNVWEWVTDWTTSGPEASTTTALTTNPYSFTSDIVFGVTTQGYNGTAFVTGLPVALGRGGGSGDNTASGPYAIRADQAPSASNWWLGFRCCIGR